MPRSFLQRVSVTLVLRTKRQCTKAALTRFTISYEDRLPQQ